MARTEIPIIVMDALGNAIPNASVRVKYRGSTDATVYQSETGPTTITNPMLTDATGRVTGWVERDKYEAYIVATGYSPYTEYFESVPGADGGIDTDWLADQAITNAKVNNSAALAYSKLALAGSLVNADFSTSAGITEEKSAGPLFSGVGTSISNTAAETNIFSQTITGGYMGTGRALILTMGALVLNNTGTSTHTITLRVKFGGTTIWGDVSNALVTSATDRPFFFDCILCNANSSSAQGFSGHARIGAAENASVAGNGGHGTPSTEWQLHATSSINTAVNQTFAVSGQFNTNSTLLTFIPAYYTIHLR